MKVVSSVLLILATVAEIASVAATRRFDSTFAVCALFAMTLMIGSHMKETTPRNRPKQGNVRSFVIWTAITGILVAVTIIIRLKR